MNNNKVKVLYIAGANRSGSTILHNVLGQLDGFLAIGQLRDIWGRGFIKKDSLCGCGVPFRKCGLWWAIMLEAFGGIDRVDFNKMFRLTQSFRLHHIPLMLIPYIKQCKASQLSEYQDNLEKLYSAIQSACGCKVIVDSTKSPTYGYILRMIPTIDLYVVQLIRDSRAIAYSWSRKKLYQQDEYMPQYNPVKSSLQWYARNFGVAMLLTHKPEQYLMLRYEDFVNKPQKSIESILNMVQETSENLPFVTEHKVKIKTNHSVYGNQVRFQTGTVELKLDEEWKTKMKKLHKIIVTVITWPLLRRYKYIAKLGK